MKWGASHQGTKSWIYILLILATISVTYVPVIASDYAYADDYWLLSMRPLNSKTISDTIHNQFDVGRPLFPIWSLLVMGQVKGIQDLRFVRCLALVGLFFASVVFYQLIRRHLFEDPIDASLIACIFSISPASLIMAGWATLGFYPYACLLGLLSGHVLLLDARFNAPSSKGDSNSETATIAGPAWGRMALSALLLFLALSIYQPTGMLYWTGAAIWIIGRFTGHREDWIKLARIGGVFFAVLIAYFLFSSTLAASDSRFHASLSVIRRLVWFVLNPLKNSLSFPLLQASDLWSIAALLILSFGVWLFCRQTSRSMWIPPLLLMLSPLTVLPTVFAYQHYDVSRTRQALYALIIILWCLTFKAISRYGGDSIKLKHILISALLILIVSGQYHLQRYLVIPQLREESVLLVKLQEYVRENPKLDRLIVLFPPPLSPPMTEFHGTDEMGFSTLSRHGDPSYEIRQLLAGITNQGYEDVPDIKLLTIYEDRMPPQSSEIPPDAFYIDLRQLRAPP